MECGHRREYGIHWHQHCIWLCKACHHHQRIDIHQFFHFLWKVKLLNHECVGNLNMFSGYHLLDILIHWLSTVLIQVACSWRKMTMFQRAGMREGGLVHSSALPPAFQYLILMKWRVFDLNFVLISLLASKFQDFKLRGLQFHKTKMVPQDFGRSVNAI